MEHVEYCDVFNENGQPTGQIKSIKDVHRDGDWHAVVHVWILNSNEELLIAKRSRHVDTNPNMWSVSAAGHISAGDKPLITAARESAEELGIAIQENRFEYLFTVKHGSILNSGKILHNSIVNVYLVKMDIDIKKLKLQREEVAEAKFVHFAELERIYRSSTDFVRHDEEYEKLFALLRKAANEPSPAGIR